MDLSALSGRSWDLVIDTSGQLPRQVQISTRQLMDVAQHYTFVSSISAYADFSRPVTEDAPLAVLEDPDGDDASPESYGGRKALCEQEVGSAFPGRSLVIRPGLIVGPYDPTDRFTYWPYRITLSGEVLAPAPEESPIQFIDARDLALWMLQMAERRQAGTYNATGPAERLSMGEFLSACRQVSESTARLTWVNEDFIKGHGVEAWSDLPLWVPPSDIHFGSFLSVDCRKAVDAGLTYRPLEQTIHETLLWVATLPAEHQWQAGLSRERERALLDAWSNYSSS